MIRFFVGPLLAALSILIPFQGVIAASGGIVFNALYDCGPGRNQFKVLDCNGSMCTVFYPKGNGGVGFKSKIDRESLAESINGTYGGTRTPCKIQGQIVHANSNGDHPKPVAPKRVAANGPLVMGRYECFLYAGGHLESALMENFSLFAGGRYRDAGGHEGTFSANGAELLFHGGGLNGRRAHYTPGVPGSNNPPHVHFYSPRGGFADACDGKG